MSGAAVACSIIVFIEALIFGLFTCIMFFDQISAIFENTPGIDAMQNKRGERVSVETPSPEYNSGGNCLTLRTRGAMNSKAPVHHQVHVHMLLFVRNHATKH